MNTSDPNVRKQLDEEAKYRINGFEAPVNDRIWADAQSYAAQPGVTPDMVTARFMGALPPSYLEKARKSSQDQQWKQEEQKVKQYAFSYMKDKLGYTQSQCENAYKVILPELNGVIGFENRVKKIPLLLAEVTMVSSPGRFWDSTESVPAFEVDYRKRNGWYVKEEGTKQVKRFRYNPNTRELEEQ